MLESPLEKLPEVNNPGYHKKEIPKGEVGELSKIYEELLEAYEAENQGVGIMTLIELSDLVGAVDSFLQKHYPNFTLNDLIKMSDVTKRAFNSGRRS